MQGFYDDLLIEAVQEQRRIVVVLNEEVWGASGLAGYAEMMASLDSMRCSMRWRRGSWSRRERVSSKKP